MGLGYKPDNTTTPQRTLDMATKEELLDPDFVPYEGELRFLQGPGQAQAANPTLQQYQSRHGWHDVPRVRASDIPTDGATPNAVNA